MTILEVYTHEDLQTERPFPSQYSDLNDWSESTDATWLVLAAHLYDQLGYGERRAECVAVAVMPPLTDAVWKLSDNPLIAVVDGIEKPGNLGAMLRTGGGAGVDAFIVTNPIADLYNPNVIRASTGAVFSLPTYIASAAITLEKLASYSIQILATRVDAKKTYDEFDLTRPTAIVLGSEANGLSEIWNHHAVTPVSIPMAGHVDSLNVSVAAAILFYESQRQRTRHTI
ncbi:MAG: RNA methyltransferase [Planctomycetota bacterium]|nr:RNA methyltransferase [Planctomycetota bacterium]